MIKTAGFSPEETELVMASRNPVGLFVKKRKAEFGSKRLRTVKAADVRFF
jgi:hypothetical protein